MPDAPRGNARYRRIMRFATRQLLVTWWYEILLPPLGLGRVTARTRTRRLQRFARKYRTLAIDLGGLMIKLGQFMSSRQDVLPPEFTRELTGLQDKVPPVPWEQIQALAETELGVPLERVFAHIDPEPVAAASLGQAHRGRLADTDAAETGLKDVVVKVQRPGIEGIVAIDLAALRKVGRWMSKVRLVSRRVDMPALVEEFARTSLHEIDYLHEAANLERFSDNHAHHARVRVPAVAWERTTRRVLTLEDVSAIKITDDRALREAGIDPAEVASVFAEIMFDQFFEHSFFHADPHPGNLFVQPTTDRAPGAPPWQVVFVDFGMMGEIPETLRPALRGLLVAAAGRDSVGMVQAMTDAGVLLPNADIPALQQVVGHVFARFGGMGFADLRNVDPKEFQAFAREFGGVLRTMPFQLPKDLLLLYRGAGLTSGLCSTLNPDYNVWDTIEPYAQRLVRDEAGAMVKDFAFEAWQVARTLWRLPGRLDALITQANDGTLAITSPPVEQALARARRAGRHTVAAIIGGAVLIAGALVRADDATLGNALMLGSILPALVAVLGRRP